MKTILALLLLSTIPGLARLGETEAESVARYGLPMSTSPGAVDSEKNDYFSKDGINIDVTFYHDRACSITYTKTTRSPGGERDAFTKDELQLLLDQNAQGQKWEAYTVAPADSAYEKAAWHRADGATAVEILPTVLYLADGRNAALVAEEKKKKEDDSKKAISGL